MSTLQSSIAAYQFNRGRTLALLTRAEKEPNPRQVLGWRPGPGRAHVAWQLMHIAITEELFATERLLPEAKPAWPDLVPRFRGGSTPDDEIPSPEEIRRILTESREHLLATLIRFGDHDLNTQPEGLPEGLKKQNFKLLDVLYLLSWHEAHHQGQAHITLNLSSVARSPR
jgi:uncharacterized damage-inducible protein DinB